MTEKKEDSYHSRRQRCHSGKILKNQILKTLAELDLEGEEVITGLRREVRLIWETSRRLATPRKKRNAFRKKSASCGKEEGRGKRRLGEGGPISLQGKGVLNHPGTAWGGENHPSWLPSTAKGRGGGRKRSPKSKALGERDEGKNTLRKNG